MEEQRQIDWGSARVRDGGLTVELSGDASKGWKRRFETVLVRLERGSGRWGEIELAKGKITVADVESGAEEDLRHLLESVVQQVNADLHDPEPEAPADDDGGDAGKDSDHRMTEAFQSFAGEPAD